jgi:hypothetical protein
VCAWVASGGQSASVVHSASDQVWCGGRLPVVAHTVKARDSGVTLGYRDADSLQELRLLLACVPARTPSLLRSFLLRSGQVLLLTQPLEVRPDDSRVELEANAAIVAKGNRDELPRRVHRRDGPIVLAVLTCLGSRRGYERRGLAVTCASSREGGGEVLSGHRASGNDGEVDTHAPVSVARAPRDDFSRAACPLRCQTRPRGCA